MDFETRAIHEGQEPDPTTGAVAVPIYQTSTFIQEEVAQHKGYVYARSANPTRKALEECLASLESADHGFAFSSGMAATTTVTQLLNPGDRTRGRERRLRRHVPAVRQGARAEGLPLRLHLRRAVQHATSRPRWTRTRSWSGSSRRRIRSLNIVDIRAVADAAHAVGALVVVDNTFATPYLQRPLELGADIVVHSTTKYIGGHSDVIGGFAATNDPTVAERIKFLQNSMGGVPGPFDSWLVLRGLKTLAVRMRQHCENAHRIAAYLAEHAAVTKVYFPGLPDHPGHELAAAQMSDFGGMISFLLATKEDALTVAGATKVWQLGESLGGVESLIEHPGLMTHASTADSPFAVPETLIRLSVGIESADDLIADLEQALAKVPAAAGAASD